MTTRRSLIAALAVLLAGCGTSTHSTATTSSIPQASTPTLASPPATTPAATTPTGTAARTTPAAGPVPAGFDPIAFTAISPREFWLLGTAPCPRPICTSIVRTTDGGAHFVGIPAPVARLASASGAGLSVLLFADRQDGFAGSAQYPEPQPLWETHDGGAHWTRGRTDVIAFTVTAGHIYAITGRCSKNSGVCSQLRLAHSPASEDHWSSVPFPGSSASGLPSLAAAGGSAWISLTPASGTPRHQVLLTSRDGGRTLTAGMSPCYPGLAGRFAASSTATVWAVCPTGMEAMGWRSGDGGAHWSPVPGHPLPGLNGGLANSLQLAPASDSSVLLLPGGSEPAFRSTDGGVRFTRVGFPTVDAGVTFVGFTDPNTGSALVDDVKGGRSLWRSTDGGVHWRAIRIAGTS